MSIQNRRIIASILFVLISFVCMAQDPPPPGGPTPPPPNLPIDGGIVTGVLFAIFFGIKKIISTKKEN